MAQLLASRPSGPVAERGCRLRTTGNRSARRRENHATSKGCQHEQPRTPTVVIPSIGACARVHHQGGPNDASGMDAGADSVSVDAAVETDARPTAPKLPPPSRRALAAACSGAGECASGFCVDGLCCDSACDAECLACDLAGSSGHCTALDGGRRPLGDAPMYGNTYLREGLVRRDRMPVQGR